MTWSIIHSDICCNFRAQIATRLGVPIEEIQLNDPDGLRIGDSKAMSSLDIEEDDLLDIKIKPSLVDEAVARASRFNSREEEPVNSIKLITRLNGQHEHKWKINRANPLSKLHDQVAQLYGLQLSQVTMKFDGDVIGGNKTPDDLDMDDENLIDIKIDKIFYDAAIATAQRCFK